jgi:hypothetical protein
MALKLKNEEILSPRKLYKSAEFDAVLQELLDIKR